MTPPIKNTALLELLAMAIFADKRVYSEEIKTFVRVSQQLYKRMYLDETVTGAAILNWYEDNKDRLMSKVSGDFKAWFQDIIPEFDTTSFKDEILKAIRDISLADNDDHVSEKALTVLLARRWGMSNEEALTS